MSVHDLDKYRKHPGQRDRASAPRSATPPAQVRRPRSAARSPWLLWGGLLLLGVLIAYVIGGVSRQQPFPPPGTVHWYAVDKDGPTAPLTLQAPYAGPADFAVRLDHWDTHAAVVLVPIRSGKSTSLEMPLGRYRMTIVKGLIWQGPGKLFHITTDAREVVEPLEFTRVGNNFNGHTIQLETLGGNMDTRRAR